MRDLETVKKKIDKVYGSMMKELDGADFDSREFLNMLETFKLLVEEELDILDEMERGI